MGRFSKMFLFTCLSTLLLSMCWAEETEKNAEEAVEEAEYRQGGVGQQYLSAYPGTGLYANGYQYMGNGANSASYSNMLRQIYRPSSIGLTDKVKNWVKSFLNRRQYVKPFYSPSMAGLTYNADSLNGKPVYMGGASYKPVVVPLRQIQKYYKPYYGGAEADQSQFVGAGQSTGQSSSLSNAVGTYGGYAPSSPDISNSGILGASDSSVSGLYTAGSGPYAGVSGSSSSAMYGSSGSSSNNNGALFGATGGYFHQNGGISSSGLLGSNNNNGALFAASNPGSLFAAGNAGGLYGSRTVSSGGAFNPSSAQTSVYSSSSGNSGVGGNSYMSSSGASGSSYIPGVSAESSQSYSMDSAYDPAGNYPVESAYSVTYHRPQAKSSYTSSNDPAGFQPVSFESDSSQNSNPSLYSADKKA